MAKGERRTIREAGLALDLKAFLDSPRVTGHVHEFRQRLAPHDRAAPCCRLGTPDAGNPRLVGCAGGFVKE